MFDEVHQGQAVAGSRADAEIVLAAGRCHPQPQDHHQGVEGDPQAGAALHASGARPGLMLRPASPEESTPSRRRQPPPSLRRRLTRGWAGAVAGSMSRPQSPSRGAGSHPGGKEARERAATLLPALRGQAAAAGHPKPPRATAGAGAPAARCLPGPAAARGAWTGRFPPSFSRGSSSGRSGQRRGSGPVLGALSASPGARRPALPGGLPAAAAAAAAASAHVGTGLSVSQGPSL